MNIDKIEITENDISLTLFPKTNKLSIGEKEYKIEPDVTRELIRIIRTWDNEYIDNTYFDGNRYEIRIYQDNNVDVLKGTRNGPRNYKEFSKLIRSIYGRR